MKSLSDILQVPFNKLAATPFSVTIYGAIPQIWKGETGWSEFRDKPRFSSALVGIIEDIQVRYVNNDGEIVYAEKGDIIYTPYNGKYVFELLTPCNDDTPKTITINFNMTTLNEEILILSDRPLKVVENQQDICSSLVSLGKSCKSNDFMKAYSMLYELLNNITNINLNNSASYHLIKKGLRTLQKNFDKNITTAQLAELCNLSESHFRKIFKEHTGMTPVELRNKMRINHAKELMANGNVSISAASEAVGITDPFYFSRLFKSIEGISPMEFKKGFTI